VDDDERAATASPGQASTVTVRPAVPDDAPAMYALSLRAIRGSASEHYTGAQLEAWAARRSVAGHRRLVDETRTFVAVRGGVVVGFASLATLLDEAEVLVDQLFVDPAVGGRGVARSLLAAVHDAARAAGVRRVITHASWRAVPVFERLGYRRVDVETVQVGDQTLTRALMHHDLDTA
jgi:putative acetyltransferase